LTAFTFQKARYFAQPHKHIIQASNPAFAATLVPNNNRHAA